MSPVIALVKKELRSYFYSPVAYVVLGIFLFLIGIIFTKFVHYYHMYNAAQSFGAAPPITLDKLAAGLYQNMAFLLCFITPFLTMKLFAEERRQQTYELLFTAPIGNFALVFGKFLAAFLLMFLMILVTFVYTAFMIAWGNPEVNIILSTYVGLSLSLACYVALGGLISAMTSSQALAAIFTFVALILLWLLQSIAQGLVVRWGFIDWGPTLNYISPLGHFGTFAEGMIQMKDIVYFISALAFLLFLTNRVVESNRWR